VTGVQTCALPIFESEGRLRRQGGQLREGLDLVVQEIRAGTAAQQQGRRGSGKKKAEDMRHANSRREARAAPQSLITCSAGSAPGAGNASWSKARSPCGSVTPLARSSRKSYRDASAR